MPKLTCVMLLSDKSSGSSVLQNELAKHPDINLVKYTRHNEQETLYWNKAVAILGLPQAGMLNSELPFNGEFARRDLSDFLNKNIGVYESGENDLDWINESWRQLSIHNSPVFLEKTPHHLHCHSALDLIEQCIQIMPEIDFKFIGLIRNPMDTLYSMWTRWRDIPEKRQYEWLRAYRNLQAFEERLGPSVFKVRYEDLMLDKDVIKKLCEFIGVNWMPDIGSSFRYSSIQKWQKDKLFGFQLADEVRVLANNEGYKAEELVNESNVVWPFYQRVVLTTFNATRFVPKYRRFARRLLKRDAR